MKTANIMVIGAGAHARRIYIPIITKLSRSMPVCLVAIVDLQYQKESVDLYLKVNDCTPEILYLDPSDGEKGLSSVCTDALDTMVKDLSIQGVVISTEPLVHKMYAEWALERGLHILMDKPISVRKSVNTDASQAAALIEDYDDLLALYQKTQDVRSTAFLVNVQRRYEHGFDKVKELITEVKDTFNMPITSIQAMHADGTWIFPKEVLHQRYHGYSDGYGKVAHSGYHIFDMVWQLYEAGLVDEKRPDQMEILSSPLLPGGFSIDLNEEDYQKCFGDEYNQTALSEEEYQKKVKSYGEIDSFNIIRLLKDTENVCNISINLLHSSFSRRSWEKPNRDRYKGNGRVKHQQFIIQQGPFQCIQIHNYQSNDAHDVDNSDEFDIGGNNHFEIHVFRNSGMFGTDKSFYTISAKDLEEERSTGLFGEKAKERVLLEFVNFMLGKIAISDLKSNIDTHSVPVKIMSGVYQSSARLAKHENPLIKMSI